jgi:isoleucyl-tRNA synthetase
MTKDYEANILRAFRLLVKQGHVYRGLKPVQWCITCETALAEAEVEYKDKTSPSVYVAFPVKSSALAETKGASVLIWTTTPWTLPANVAVAFHPLLEYAIVEASKKEWPTPKTLILAKSRLESVQNELGVTFRVLSVHRGDAFAEFIYERPYSKADGVGVLAEYVTADDGTGVVHTAPGHGEDDFHTGQRYGLEVLNPVDASGRFTAAAPQWAGKKIFEEGNPEIIADLQQRGWLLARKDIQHSYPHCWRCKNPVVFRTTEQWFLRLSEALREHLLSQIAAAQSAPWEAFKVCSRMLRCDPKPILAMRDQALWYDWPTVFDYLKISRDWGEAPMSDFAHNEFLAARGEKGTDVLRSNCLPKITFENMNGESFYHFEGFVCEKAPAS